MNQESNADPKLTIRLEHFVECQTAIDALFREAQRSTGADKAFRQFLDVGIRFSNLSVFNSMLVAIQRPGAVAVGSRIKWAGIGRTIKPGAPPLLILWPFGPVAYLYEYSDTEGDEIDGAQANLLFAEGQPPPTCLEHLIKAAGGYDIVVDYSDRLGPLSAGLAHAAISQAGRVQGKKPRPAWRILLNGNLDAPSTFATLAHELGHIYCGHLGEGPNAAWPGRRHLLGEAEQELEAEAVSHIVCQRNGIRTRSAEYLASHVNRVDLDRISIFSIYEAANRVESRTHRVAPGARKSMAQEPISFPELFPAI
ncbi:ImmA/IrrE family metallo-endopeptidase [Novilysobacter erysipheiresistens]|uniref:IrrE N-terminal-like domain-containing protein n=1 Tax=Novilysobacter erysipheiresistens TaxID=1749332 RepID=A0ABU7YW69_9GAMM